MARSSSRGDRPVAGFGLSCRSANACSSSCRSMNAPARGRARGAQQRPPAFRPPLGVDRKRDCLRNDLDRPEHARTIVHRRDQAFRPRRRGAHAAALIGRLPASSRSCRSLGKAADCPEPSRSILGVVPGKRGKWRVMNASGSPSLFAIWEQARAAPILRQPRDKEHQRAADESHSAQGIRRVGIGPLFEDCANSTTRRYPRDHRRGPDREGPSTAQAPPLAEECRD